MKTRNFCTILGLAILLILQPFDLYAADTAWAGLNVVGLKNKKVNMQIGGAKPSLQLDSAREIPLNEAKYFLAFDSSGKVVAKMSMDSLKKKLTPQPEAPQMFSSGYYSCSANQNPEPFLSVYTDSLITVNISNSILCISGPSQPCQTRDLKLDWPNSGSFIFWQSSASIAIIDDYIYILIFQVDVPSYGAFVPRVYRFNKSNISTGGTVMTFIGLPLSINTQSYIMSSNGKNFYFSYDAGNSTNANTIAKYSLGGLNLNYVSSVTCGVSTDFRNSFIVDTNENIHTCIITPSIKIRLFTFTGTFVREYYSISNYLMNFNNVLYGTSYSSFSTAPFLFYEKINR